MQVSFVETMRGSVRDDDGGEHPLVLELKAEAPSLVRFLRDGNTRASGLVRCEPWADECPVEGVIELSLRGRRISYRLGFEGNQGDSYVVSGAKNVRVEALLATMTTLPVTLRRGDVVLASGTVHFDLRELLPFAASWLPGARPAQRRLDARRRAVARRLLAGA